MDPSRHGRPAGVPLMTREEKLAAAARYVLGDMEDAERMALEAAIPGDVELASAVDRLASEMQALDDTAGSLPVSEGLWQRIASQLETVPSPAAMAAKPSLPRRARALPPWTALAASVVVAAGLGFLAGNFVVPTPKPVVIAVLINEGAATPGAIVEAFADNSVRIVPLEAFDVPEGRILQVWTLPDADTGPVSLGTFADPASIRLAGASLPAPQPGQLYEITLEPAPGSPTGRPTGPILVKGFARNPL
jgi:anti-sigma-K factor RskA